MGSKSDTMKFLRNLGEEDAVWARVEAALQQIEPPFIEGSPEPKMVKPKNKPWVDDKFNPGYLVELRDIYLNYNTEWQNYYAHQWPKLKDMMSIVTEMAKQYGIDLATYAPETFSLSNIKHLDDLFEAGGNQCLELADRIVNSHETALTLIDDAKKKRWAKVLRQVAKIQDLCRNPIPPSKAKETIEVKEVWKYMHPLRYLLYVERSELMSEDGTPLLMDLPPHIIMMCLVSKIGEAHSFSQNVDGALMVIPPRHGKTKFMVCDTALDIIEHPHFNEAIIHNAARHAKARYRDIKEHFNDGISKGRRRRALFPHVSLDPSVDNDERFYILVHNKRVNTSQEGNLSAWGIHAKAQGLTFHKIRFDDPSDEKETIEAGTRERTNRAIFNTWMRRLTGRYAFFSYICTRWHPDTAESRLIKQARTGTLNLAYYSEACGGPNEDFESIWPEAGYDRDYLMKAYYEMGPSEYACVYQNDPDSAESRRIARIHYYNRDEWTEPDRRSANFARFFASGETVYSITSDPSGTDSQYSNLAGIMLSAYGHLRRTLEDGSHKDEPKLLFLDYWSLPASQHKVAEIIVGLHDTKRIDTILIETTAGLHATADLLTITHGIPATKVIKRAPGQGTKVERLMRFAALLEEGDVLFPGEWTTDERGEPVLRLHSEWEIVASQVLRAGSVKETNILDCVSLQVSEVAYDIFRAKEPFILSDKKREQKTPRQIFFEKLTNARSIRARKKSSLPRNHLFLTRSLR